MSDRPESIESNHARIRSDAKALAGRPEDLVQRASVYLQIYRHSHGNHGFPLLAAHGALWGAGHFRRGIAISKALTFTHSKAHRKAKRSKVAAFASAFKEINRQVCVETFTAYHLTRLHGADPALSDYIPGRLISALNSCHTAGRNGRMLDADERRDLFEAFFLWEQEAIVGPSVEKAVEDFDWPLMRAISMRPPIGFSYFGPAQWLFFRSFGDKPERIQRGRQAFQIAEKRGWKAVEARLFRYRLMPSKSLQKPDQNFRDLARNFDVGGYISTN